MDNRAAEISFGQKRHPDPAIRGFFGGFAGFAQLLSSRVACVVVYAKVLSASLGN